jgi:hypothetical protein
MKVDPLLRGLMGVALIIVGITVFGALLSSLFWLGLILGGILAAIGAFFTFTNA